jgi:hypothetical protein
MIAKITKITMAKGLLIFMFDNSFKLIYWQIIQS